MKNIEYEAKFININKDSVRENLKLVGAELIKPEFLQKRVVFNLPTGHEIKGGWLRVRDSIKNEVPGLYCPTKKQKEQFVENYCSPSSITGLASTPHQVLLLPYKRTRNGPQYLSEMPPKDASVCVVDPESTPQVSLPVHGFAIFLLSSLSASCSPPP